MIIYSVTVSVEKNVHEEWLGWMKDTHIPDVMKTGYFTENLITRVLTTAEDEAGITYNIQYHCPSMADLDEYQRDHAPALQKDHTDRYKDKFVAFRSLLEKV